MKKLGLAFYLQPTLIVARELLGKHLIKNTPQGKLIGRIVETEAYLQDDPASHSYKGLTPRCAPMFLRGGVAYVYFIYGMYDCFNVVTEKSGYGSAVLIRALAPITGQEIMWQNRFPNRAFSEKTLHQLCNGPGKLTRALGITVRQDNRKSLLHSDLAIYDPKQQNLETIQTEQRIGISQASDKYWRFYLANNPCVSTWKATRARDS